MADLSRRGQSGPQMSSFAKILIANRGEIACRSCARPSRLGYRTVAVFTMRTPKPCTAPRPTRRSVSGRRLRANLSEHRRLLAAAKLPGRMRCIRATAFLSENAEFARPAPGRACLHWPAAGGNSRDGQQGCGQRLMMRRASPACRAMRARIRSDESCGGSGAHRLSRHGEGGGRWWRPRHAPGR